MANPDAANSPRAARTAALSDGPGDVANADLTLAATLQTNNNAVGAGAPENDTYKEAGRRGQDAGVGVA